MEEKDFATKFPEFIFVTDDLALLEELMWRHRDLVCLTSHTDNEEETITVIPDSRLNTLLPSTLDVYNNVP